MWRRHREQQRSTPVKREAVIAGLASEGLALISYSAGAGSFIRGFMFFFLSFIFSFLSKKGSFDIHCLAPKITVNLLRLG